MASLNPYLSFDDNCMEAFDHYKSVFGGEFVTVMRFKDMPSENPVPEGEGEKLMHISLPISGGSVLMGSDTPAGMGQVSFGNNFSISISVESEEEANRLFNGLAEGGKITMPLQDQFWGSYFGMVQDKFGVNWMVSYGRNRNQN